MSTYDELLVTVKVVRDRTGDPNAWQAGLTPAELAAVVTPTTRAQHLETLLAKIRRQHPDLFNPGTAPLGPPPHRSEGAAAEAIAGAEAALAHQNSASSQLDLQVISAIMNAHLKTVEGADALSALQREIEAAVQTRSDLDTPAGARDFQRFLIGKLRDIRSVVMTASLDDTSKSALMAAWTSLYDASKGPSGVAAETRPAAVATPAPAPDPAADPLLDSLLAEDPGPLAGDSEPSPAETAPAPALPSALPGIPNFGMGSAPAPGSMGGWGTPSGLAIPGRQEGSDTDPALDDEGLDADPFDPESDDRDEHQAEDHGADASAAEAPPAGPTTVTLPDGETVTAASPQLAAAIQAAVGGASIPEAFQQQGITIPAPGTAVASPIDPMQVVPGDIGIFTDRHALALGHTKALLDGQIQHIATVSGPSFLGWEHPPAATTATAPARTEAPTPTRPAATPSTGQ
ncbi:hypothetical protein AWC29_29085 [Mycobacterium triplex]|uniref:Biofilm regulator BssS n=1 Tax=Mycobacterium triplex TaxID=47839 RepID=A0A024JR50_9MYCO|nr:DUF4226 domain-containing protein [Mycobacterium triplex]ORW99046.1 hypothetical protein AWC29_29085 [Mycobacterium triplex]CDO86096.1 Biofilm regulator BssS [Mycobacterium triplex]